MKQILSNFSAKSMPWIFAVIIGLVLGGCSGPDTPSPTTEPPTESPCEGEGCTTTPPIVEVTTPPIIVDTTSPTTPPEPTTPTPQPVDEDDDGYTEDVDCNDADDTIHPEAEDQCDEIDQDCDGDPTNGQEITFYHDIDSDGFGDPDNFTEACSLPTGFVTNDDDCNDANIAINPDATEVCDLEDNDCDKTVDEGFPTSPWYPDSDGDGYGTQAGSYVGCQLPGFVAVPGDCNDGNATSYPDATEVCDLEDNDCDKTVDEGFPTSSWYPDLDGDGYGTQAGSYVGCQLPGFVGVAGDCNDGNANIHPGAPEFTGDSIDNNCDGTIDEPSTWDVSSWEEGVWGE